jgi:hypothetical protein
VKPTTSRGVKPDLLLLFFMAAPHEKDSHTPCLTHAPCLLLLKNKATPQVLDGSRSTRDFRFRCNGPANPSASARHSHQMSLVGKISLLSECSWIIEHHSPITPYCAAPHQNLVLREQSLIFYFISCCKSTV